MDRRSFVKGAMLAGTAVASGFAFAGCSASGPNEQASEDAAAESDDLASPNTEQGGIETNVAKELPTADPDPESDYGVDRSINIETVDQWLGRDDVAYRDVRMLFDSADFASIGGDPNLSATIEGFKVVPFPLLATLPPLPVAGAYDGPTAWTVEWAEDGSIASANPAYEESQQLLEDLFPKDRAIFIMCGAGAYAGLAKQLLVHLGWDAEKIYNVGGFWLYGGSHKVELIVSSSEGDKLNLMWRADVAPIDFTWMHSR